MNERPQIPRYTELEAFRRSVNRKLWGFVAPLGLVAVITSGAAAHMMIRPTPVVVIDSKGQPVLFQDTVEAPRQMNDVRIRYFARDFIKHFVGIDSANLTEDLTQSFAMMTPSFREIVRHEGKEVERRRLMNNGNVKSHIADIEFSIAPYDAKDQSEKILLYAWGKMEYLPKFGELETEEPYAQWFFTEMRLERVPVTELSIAGLQVDFVMTRFFNSNQDLRIDLMKKT